MLVGAEGSRGAPRLGKEEEQGRAELALGGGAEAAAPGEEEQVRAWGSNRGGRAVARRSRGVNGEFFLTLAPWRYIRQRNCAPNLLVYTVHDRPIYRQNWSKNRLRAVHDRPGPVPFRLTTPFFSVYTVSWVNRLGARLPPKLCGQVSFIV